jgi:probable addiction module antidote protein
MGKTETRTWDVGEHLKTPSDMAAYLEAALEVGDPKLVPVALYDIARATGTAQIRQDS